MKYETSFVVYPQDTNALKMDMVFGGKMMSEMDKAAAIVVKHLMLQHKMDKSLYAVTVGVNKLSFTRGAYLGNLVRITADYENHGKTSVTIKVKAYVEDLSTGDKKQMSSGLFTFCIVKSGPNGENIPIEHGW